jgi:tetratricopeptide (TPR) repeat protein
MASVLPVESRKMAKIGRNDRCPCGSGKKYKQCCLAKDEVAERAAREQRRAAVATTQAPDHLPQHHPHLCQDCNAEIDNAANTVIALIDAGELDKAEHAAQAIVERWPDIYDGYDCLGMVCHARGDKPQAAGYYRKVISFARQDPGLYDAQFEDYYQALIASLEPTGRMGALPPNPRDI